MRILILSLFLLTSLYSSEKLSKVQELGNASSLLLYKTMLGEVKKQLDSKKTHEVMAYCSENAQEIKEKVTSLLPSGVKIKRVSDKIRNQNNQASPRDLDIIEEFKKLKNDGKSLKRVSKVVEDSNSYSYYKPLIISDKCLLCHGAREKLEVGVKKFLDTVYPKDMATGYKKGDIRGLVVIEIDKKSI